MTYFDLFVAASWTFVIGWFSAAIYLQNRKEKAPSPRPTETPEASQATESQQLSTVASAVAAD
jgi:hypothetical protein